MGKQNSHGLGDNGEESLKSQIFPSTNIDHRHCPTAMYDLNAKDPEKYPVTEIPVSSRDSIMSLRNFFVRNKQEKNEKYFGENSAEIPISSKETMTTRKRISGFTKRISLKGNLLSKKCGETNPVNPTLSCAPLKKDAQTFKHIRRSNSMPGSKPGLVKSMKRTQYPTIDWEIPPFFQAYPQAIKHSCLSALTCSAEQILNSDSRQTKIFCERIASLDQKHSLNRSNVCSEQVTFDRAAECSFSQRCYNRKSNKSVSTTEWTQKIFVLVTSGYLLQYSGSGRFDRMPEKLMQLGKDSVAFACDAIPGKHWVLQVSQSMNSEGHSLSNSRSLFSRLDPRSTGHRRAVKSFLLVFDCAEELEAWISVLRKEIKSIATRQQNPETPGSIVLEKPILLPQQSCKRSLSQNTTNHYPQPLSTELEHQTTENDFRIQNKAEIDSKISSKHLSAATFRSSIGDHSITNSIFSHDGRILQSLSGSQHRSSYLSSDQRTMMTSQSSSLNSSPVLLACDHNNSKRLTGELNFRRISDATIENRNSLISLDSYSHESVMSSYQNSHGTVPRSHSPSNHRLIRHRSDMKKPLPKISQTTASPNFYDKRPNNLLANFPNSKRPLSYYGNIQESLNTEEPTSDAPLTDFNNNEKTAYLSPAALMSQPMIESNLFKNIDRNSEQLNYDVEVNSNTYNESLIDACSSLCDQWQENMDIPRTLSHRDKDVQIKKSCQVKSSPFSTGSNQCGRTPTHDTITSRHPVEENLLSQSHFHFLSHQYTENSYSQASAEHTRCNSLGPKHRRSLPLLLKGPPLLPPPKCALPPLPPGSFVKGRPDTVDKFSRSTSHSYI
ncbi:putative peptidase family m20 m25 m40 protein [Golovinomyces cichoracearum]|uniref:Putative peptidase family m20 m25 m40 protein n=1 Tax=Golovinomyces cichoracearum TaxID=62708 RepID=A0A420HAM6_9PEZI|nr:putative peptidase family m20 m25 m40 protein [Golovinomyces cichoracearum]